MARWGVGQRLLMLGALLLGCVTTGLALWLLTQGEAGVWEAALALDIPGLGCLLFGLGFSSCSGGLKMLLSVFSNAVGKELALSGYALKP